MTTRDSPWFEVWKRVPSPAMRLFCFPYAGGSAMMYRDWCMHVPSNVEVLAVQYPGRGTRFAEKPITRCEDMVAAIVTHMQPLIGQPFALFGHSNGGLVSFQVARLLQALGFTELRHHFISGKRPVHLPSPEPRLHALRDDRLIQELQQLGGTPRELLADRALMELMLPVVRADFTLSESFSYMPGEPVRTAASVLYGRSDTVAEEDMMRWKELIDGPVSFYPYDGGHFFINTHKRQVLHLVDMKLRQILTGLGSENSLARSLAR